MKKILLLLFVIVVSICCVKFVSSVFTPKNIKYKKNVVKTEGITNITNEICSEFLDDCDCIVTEYPDPAYIKQLAQKLVNVNEKNLLGRTALHCVPGWGEYIETVKLLIAKGADVNIKDDYGRTPIFNASEEKVKLLIAAGADVNVRDVSGMTPLDYATTDEEIKKLLIKQGAKSGKDLK
ncbi:MAG: ankyrin repeat domain-containing protein [Elusimicrobiaceae bacterium]|jgi:ankyrin repeat protein|nr:ankyrin repeat domain-containing protein [Elusimicrobiaceae bacterium]